MKHPVEYYMPSYMKPSNLDGATDAQIEALVRIYERPWNDKPHYFLQFARTARGAFGDCLMVPWSGMMLGIETDGYTHS